jgi:hypothetical protein
MYLCDLLRSILACVLICLLVEAGSFKRSFISVKGIDLLITFQGENAFE